jgi:hypothetical protein
MAPHRVRIGAVRILLDHCTPRQVASALAGHDVRTAFQMGWNELENGDLLRAAEADGFELLIMCDTNMRYQQNLSQWRIAVLELWTNHRPTLERHFTLIREKAETMQPGEYRRLQNPEGGA